ncbi:MAG: 4Fe-4S binding protein [Candidatus Accumulibacter sp.]|jgi:polyferredoxin|nr:4Fe-4S binding protein [Accumulibacter sp.]
MALNVGTVGRLRQGAQYLSFALLMYGGRLGLHLGPALPCFGCPFVPGCGGYCYLMGLQGYIGFGMNAAALAGMGLWRALGWMLAFTLLVALLGKTWCGWICPFGLLQDWLAALRKRLGVRERLISTPAMERLAWVKYGFLVYMAVIPPLATMGFLPEDFHLPFCNICPGKSILPLFAGETKYLALNLDNAVTFGFSLALLCMTGVTLVGMFFKDRFFCIFCPLLALIHLLKPLTALKLVKTPSACVGCGNCRRACPMNIEAVEKDRENVQTGECLDCARCVESCPSSAALGLRFGNIPLIVSSRAGRAEREPFS